MISFFKNDGRNDGLNMGSHQWLNRVKQGFFHQPPAGLPPGLLVEAGGFLRLYHWEMMVINECKWFEIAINAYT